MSDEPIETAVEQFLDEAASALDDYEEGYADADATLSVIRSRMDELERAMRGDTDDD
ncbi:hypothetical protein [Halorubrum laminariae]|uniref:Uncharacterized protein n=1 Tax=Halorubrum laminariae TaxID=1433523 RepID=A0ABD6BXG8_9EURY|nr:hypothetical protein [Halorubrum laminariae]